jgi:hypothetical protein
MKIIVFGLSLVLFIGIFAMFSAMVQQASSDERVHRCPPECWIRGGPHHLIQNISVQFPDLNTIYAYLNASGEKREFESITNGSDVGIPFGYKISVIEKYQDIVWLAFLGNKSGQTDVYLKKSTDGGESFALLAKLNNSTAGIPSKMQLETSDTGQLVYLVWENYNPVDNKRSVWVSSSLDAGQTFKTYSLNLPSDGNGYEPVLKVIDDDILVVWTQEPPMHCFGPHGHNNTQPVACVHGSRW